MEAIGNHDEFDEDDEVDLPRDILGRVEREYFPRMHPFIRYRERKFQARYRLSRNLSAFLADDFGQSEFATSGRLVGGGLSHRDRFCLALRYYATGAFYAAIGDTQGVHKSTVCRAVRDVTNYLYWKRCTYIQFPSRPNYHHYTSDFANLAEDIAMPCVIGCLDGTHVNIEAPHEHEKLYVNRHWRHSLNVMAVCDAYLKFLYIDSRFPGSNHDAFVLRRSTVGIEGELRRFHQFWFLGDSGYPLKPYLMTPVINPCTDAEEAYNKSHCETRASIERAFGVLKRRFRCLDESGGVILGTPLRAAKVIIACGVLHNIAVHHNLPIRIDNDWDGRQRPRPRIVRFPPHLFEPNPNDLENDNPSGPLIRRRLIDTCFSNPM